jgi:hypothetical protein
MTEEFTFWWKEKDKRNYVSLSQIPYERENSTKKKVLESGLV